MSVLLSPYIIYDIFKNMSDTKLLVNDILIAIHARKFYGTHSTLSHFIQSMRACRTKYSDFS